MFRLHQTQACGNHGSGTIETYGQARGTPAHDALLNDPLQGLKSWLILDARPTYEWRSWVFNSFNPSEALQGRRQEKPWRKARTVALYSLREAPGGEMPVRKAAAIRIIFTTIGVLTFCFLLNMSLLETSRVRCDGEDVDTVYLNLAMWAACRLSGILLSVLHSKDASDCKSA